ncbi:hypothetical protein [Sphingomonas sp. 28-63-12]|uniref:hypothetical protein n=1 Tax=Sphingomonas sp. 28-63-12 TaxID=1970434 RepID=UPI0035A99B40
MIALLLFPASAAGAAWHQARSPHFIVYADDKPEKIRDFTTRLERFDRALRILFGVPDTGESSSSRLTVYVVDDADDVAKLAGKGASSVAGFYLPRATGAVAFVPRHGDGDGKYGLNPQIVLLHEYAHHFMFSTWPSLAVPAWFSEGFAEFAATALFNKDGSLTLGSPPLYRAFEILEPSMSLKRIIAANVETLPQSLKTQIYGRGWLLTHYILLSPDRQALFTAYLAALNNGKSPIDAAAVFGDLDALDKDLTRYASHKLSGFVLKPQALAIDGIDVTPLSPGAAAMMPALIRSQRGVDQKTAPAVFALADKLAAPYPNDPVVQTALAEAAYDAQQFDAAKAAADRAIAADPRAFRALIYRGRTAIALAVRDHLREATGWTAVRRPFLAANKIDTENAEPLFLYYQSFLAAGEAPSENARAALAYAYRLAPFDPSLRMTAAYMFLRQGKGRDAREALGPVAFDPHGGGLTEVAGQAIAALDKGGPTAALAVLEGRQSAAGPADQGKEGGGDGGGDDGAGKAKPGGDGNAKVGTPPAR